MDRRMSGMSISRLHQIYDKNRGLVSNPSAWKHGAKSIYLGLRHSLNPILRKDRRRVLAGQHKAMTTYFTAVFRILSLSYNMRYVNIDRGVEKLNDADFILHYTSDFGENLNAISNCQVVKIVRDPRDLIISSYHYHLWTKEEWANTRWDGNPSLVEKLQSMSREDGISDEIRRVGVADAPNLRLFLEKRPNIIVVKYEDLLGPKRDALYEKIFRHWEFEGSALKHAVATMRLLEFESRTGRRVGQFKKGSHLRAGKSGGWRSEMTDAQIAEIKNSMNDLILGFGYETDSDWA